MSKIMELVQSPMAVLVFDIDGVLAAYEYGDCSHNACPSEKWDAYVAEHDVYGNARPLKTIQTFLNSVRDKRRLFVCSVAGTDEEKEQKRAFVRKNYPFKDENILFAEQTWDKVRLLKEIYQKFPKLDPKYVVLVDDTPEVLDMVEIQTEFSTAHISSFIR